MLFTPEEFGSFSPIRMSHPPSKPTTVSLIFFRPEFAQEQIRVVFGFENNEQNDMEEESFYKILIQFETKLLKEIRADKIDNHD